MCKTTYEILADELYNNYERVAESVNPVTCHAFFIGVKNAVPCIISLLVGALYNIVDQIFIANAYYLGSYGNAANTVVFPLTVIALAIAVMVGDGCCA